MVKYSAGPVAFDVNKTELRFQVKDSFTVAVIENVGRTKGMVVRGCRQRLD